MLFTRLGRFVLGKPVPKVLSPIWTSKLANNTYLLLKGITRYSLLPVTGRTLTLIDSNYTASEECFISRKPPSAYQSQDIYYI